MLTSPNMLPRVDLRSEKRETNEKISESMQRITVEKWAWVAWVGLQAINTPTDINLIRVSRMWKPIFIANVSLFIILARASLKSARHKGVPIKACQSTEGGRNICIAPNEQRSAESQSHHLLMLWHINLSKTSELRLRDAHQRQLDACSQQ